MKEKALLTPKFLVKRVCFIVVLLILTGQHLLAEDIRKKVTVIGHRGAAGLAPENTITGFSQALKLGVDAIELDVHMTSDDQIVVHHDFYLNSQIARTPEGKWLKEHKGLPIKELSLATLKTFDVGRLKPHTSYARKYLEQKPVDGERIPTLREAVRLLKHTARNTVQLWIEIKTTPEEPKVSSAPEDAVNAVVQLLKDEHFVERVKILSFDWRALIYIQKITPNIQTVYLTSLTKQFKSFSFNNPWESIWTSGLKINDYDGSIPRTIKAAGGRFWAPKYTQATPELIKEAHELGLGVAVWTPDEDKDFRRLLKMGVDAIITNRADRLLRILKE